MTARAAARTAELKRLLDVQYAQFDDAASVTDPIQIVRRYTRPDDVEVVGFIASALAFGRVQSVLNSIERVLAAIGPAPADFVREFRPDRDAVRFEGIVHRWTRGIDLAALIWILRQMFESHGSLEGFFASALPADAATIEDALDAFSRRACALDRRAVYGRQSRTPGVGYFFARPSSGGACKRLNLFLRWMARHDGVDLGIWTKVKPSQLVIPLDTHTIRLGRCLRLTRYTSPGWRMATDITASLRRLDPDDPVRYDFALCHLGMMNACGFGTARGDTRCPLRGCCRPRAAEPPGRDAGGRARARVRS